jgi:transcriptional regulator with PAS, ATPase and Fis domain
VTINSNHDPQAPKIACRLVGEAPAIRAVRSQIARIAQSASNVLILGESGVGKGVVARLIHAASARSRQPFITVNCGALPESLIESLLFGHVRGSFTGAIRDIPGMFAVAHRGTLFLDEIAELPLPLQVKLLRAVEEKEIWPVGSAAGMAIDVRLIAATNRELHREVEQGHFREDLFYRLNVVRITVPPLRARRQDIPLLVGYLIERLNARQGTAFRGVTPDTMEVLRNAPWKGNVRELENALESAMIHCDGDVITLRDLPDDLVENDESEPGMETHREALRRFERQYVQQALEHADFDKRQAARVLGMSLASLYRKLADLGIPLTRPINGAPGNGNTLARADEA